MNNRGRRLQTMNILITSPRDARKRKPLVFTFFPEGARENHKKQRWKVYFGRTSLYFITLFWSGWFQFAGKCFPFLFYPLIQHSTCLGFKFSSAQQSFCGGRVASCSKESSKIITWSCCQPRKTCGQLMFMFSDTNTEPRRLWKPT